MNHERVRKGQQDALEMNNVTLIFKRKTLYERLKKKSPLTETINFDLEGSTSVYLGLCCSSLKIWTVSVLLEAQRNWASALKDNELILTYLKHTQEMKIIK